MTFFTIKLKTSSTILFLIAVCLFSACATQEGGKRATVLDIFGITEENRDKNTKEIVFRDDEGWERTADKLSGTKNKTTGFDGSEIIESKDAFGNITYERVFKNDLRLEGITIVKSPDGGRVVYLYARGSGKVVRLTDETAEKGLEMSADELADRAKLLKPVAGSAFDESKIASSLPVKNAVIPNQTQQDYSEDYNNNFPRTTEDDPQPTEQTKAESEDETETNPPQIADNE